MMKLIILCLLMLVGANVAFKVRVGICQLISSREEDEISGGFVLKQTSLDQVTVTGHIHNLKNDTYGVQIHEYGDISQPVASMGNVYNYFEIPCAQSSGNFTGDLGQFNVTVGQTNVTFTATLRGLLLQGDHSVIGRSMVIRKYINDKPGCEASKKPLSNDSVVAYCVIGRVNVKDNEAEYRLADPFDYYYEVPASCTLGPEKNVTIRSYPWAQTPYIEITSNATIIQSLYYAMFGDYNDSTPVFLGTFENKGNESYLKFSDHAYTIGLDNSVVGGALLLKESATDKGIRNSWYVDEDEEGTILPGGSTGMMIVGIIVSLVVLVAIVCVFVVRRRHGAHAEGFSKVRQ